MVSELKTGEIRKRARALDDAIEGHRIEELGMYFSENCEIEMPGVRLTGKEGLRKAIAWMFRYLKEIKLVPVTVMIQDNIFFEEFIVKVKAQGDREIEVKQAEVLVYGDDYKVESLRLYFDRLELARAFSSNIFDRILIGRVSRASLKGLI
jgi:hypothetical protein